VRADEVHQRLADLDDPMLVIFGIALEDDALAGGAHLLGDLDGNLRHKDQSTQKVDVARPQGDELAPTKSRLDVDEDE
jgi:hypothetical protein